MRTRNGCCVNMYGWILRSALFCFASCWQCIHCIGSPVWVTMETWFVHFFILHILPFRFYFILFFNSFSLCLSISLSVLFLSRYFVFFASFFCCCCCFARVERWRNPFELVIPYNFCLCFHPQNAHLHCFRMATAFFCIRLPFNWICFTDFKCMC